MTTNRIQVKTSAHSLQSTYNAVAAANGWNFGPGSAFCSNGDLFTLISRGELTSIRAEDNQRFLAITVDGTGVPESNPRFTSSKRSGSAKVNTQDGVSTTLTTFVREDGGNGLTSFSFTVNERKFYFVPGTYQIGVMDTADPQHVFRIQ